jgi:NAD-dependent SIR2 family protein deacetylase
VFAGAGVSCLPPSSLPLFRPLAEQIGRYSGIVRENSEREERYLGRLHERRINVQEAASEILLNPESKPHELHRLLLEFFSSPKGVRLVTTNFDKHFSTAAEAVFESEVETFYGPALPR